jgi:tetratricopeptide (TPR) repeat protein
MRLRESRIINPEAYQMYLKGRFFWNKRTKEGLEKSIEYFQSAIKKDPTYAIAYAGLADAYSILGLNSHIASHETMPKAKTAAKKALEIDSTLAEARITLAMIKGLYELDFSGAEIEFKQALELNPNYASGHQWYGLVLLSRGRLNEGFKELKLAQQLDPLSMVINFSVCQYYVDTKEFDKAIEELIKIIDLNPEFPYTYYYLSLAYEQKGMYDQAVSQYRKFIQIYATATPEQIEAFNKMYYKEGIHGIHKLFVEWLKAESKHHYVSSYNVASTYAHIGELDSAFSWLEKAYEDRDGFITNLNLDIRWENLRSAPRYKNMLKKIGLEQ